MTKHVFVPAAVVFVLASGCYVGVADTYLVFDGGADPGRGCSAFTCGAHARCDASLGRCVCDDGYHWSGGRCVTDTTSESCEGVDCGGHGTCFVIPDGRAVCNCEKGYESIGRGCVPEIIVENGPDAGSAQDAGDASDVPVQVADKWRFVVAHYEETYAIADDGSLWHWGLNMYDAFQNDPIRSPARKGSDHDWAFVNGGIGETCGIKEDGSLWCWGANGDGRLGDGTTVDALDPVPVGADNLWRSVAIENIHACAVDIEGMLWGWGWNKMGQLGIGRFENEVYSTPQHGSDRDWLSVEVGVGHSCAIRNDRTAWCWGWNGFGQVGDGTGADRSSPVAVAAEGPWLALSPGGWHTCGLKDDGSAWCWGSNDHGELGDGSTVKQRTTPGPVMQTGRFVALDSGESAVCAVGDDQTLWCWGSLDSSDFPEPPTPVRLTGDAGWLSVSVGRGHACALKADETLWCWGEYGLGQVGHGAVPEDDRSWAPLPVKIVRAR